MRNLLRNKNSFDIPFSWIFAIIAGTVILLIAIYATTQFIGTTSYIKDSEAGKQFTILLSPISNGISSAQATRIDLNKETRIYVSCDASSYGNYFFGKQMIAFSEESGFMKKWGKPGANISLTNKYVFANRIEQGKTIYIFSKPFNTGFRVDDLIFMSTENYCFVAPPSFIQTEISDLNSKLKNINLSANIQDCQKSSFKVCFGFDTNGCNASVYGSCSSIQCGSEYDYGYTLRDNKRIDYFDSLIYASIFSSTDNYECNIKRLGNKISELSSVYRDKIGIVSQKGCSSTISGYLENIMSASRNLTSTRLMNIYENAVMMDEENGKSNCEIYSSSGA